MSKDCTIQDVFHRFYSSFESTHSISPAQRKAAYHIMNCKTGAFGVNVSVCEDCGCISVHYNSCRDRCNLLEYLTQRDIQTKNSGVNVRYRGKHRFFKGFNEFIKEKTRRCDNDFEKIERHVFF